MRRLGRTERPGWSPTCTTGRRSKRSRSRSMTHQTLLAKAGHAKWLDSYRVVIAEVQREYGVRGLGLTAAPGSREKGNWAQMPCRPESRVDPVGRCGSRVVVCGIARQEQQRRCDLVGSCESLAPFHATAQTQPARTPAFSVHEIADLDFNKRGLHRTRTDGLAGHPRLRVLQRDGVKPARARFTAALAASAAAPRKTGPTARARPGSAGPHAQTVSR